MKKVFIMSCLIFAALILNGCGATGAGRAAKPNYQPFAEAGPPRPSGQSYKIKGKTYRLLDTAAGYEENGEASWYGPGFHRRKTANGERYNMNALTAAHTSLPMNTVVEVTNLENGRKVNVRINDRGPFAKNRIIDLSRQAAQAIDLGGTAQVKVKALGTAEESM